MALRFKLDIEYSQKWLAVYVSSEYTVHLYSYKNPMKPVNAPLQSIRLLDQVRERIRYMHYSLSTEKTYLHWVKSFVHWLSRKPLQFAQNVA